MVCCLTAWTNGDLSSGTSSDNRRRVISQDIPESSITKISLKATCLRLNSNFAGNNELITKFLTAAAILMKLSPQSAYLTPFTKSLISKHTMPLYWVLHVCILGECICWRLSFAENSSAILLCTNIFSTKLWIFMHKSLKATLDIETLKQPRYYTYRPSSWCKQVMFCILKIFNDSIVIFKPWPQNHVF